MFKDTMVLERGDYRCKQGNAEKGSGYVELEANGHENFRAAKRGTPTTRITDTNGRLTQGAKEKDFGGGRKEHTNHGSPGITRGPQQQKE